jgi:hypothetical protein
MAKKYSVLQTEQKIKVGFNLPIVLSTPVKFVLAFCCLGAWLMPLNQ